VQNLGDPLFTRQVWRVASGSLRTYAGDGRAGEVGQAHSTEEGAEQSWGTGGGGAGGKGPGQGEPARARHDPDTAPGTRAQCAGAGTASRNVSRTRRCGLASLPKARARCGNSARRDPWGAPRKGRPYPDRRVRYAQNDDRRAKGRTLHFRSPSVWGALNLLGRFASEPCAWVAPSTGAGGDKPPPLRPGAGHRPHR
jgi:hypothetical protein